MDSITQAALGAVVADRSLGKHIGRRAAVWGMALGTLPDLDVLISPLLSTASLLSWHRGLSHGLLATLVMAPLIGWWLHHRYKQSQVSWLRASIAVGLIWLMHVLIDCLNLYGTGIWEPFSSAWFSFRLLFIIDPLFSLPLVMATAAALIWSARRRWRLPLTWIFLGLSCCYVGWAATAKNLINARLAASLDNLKARDVQIIDWHSAPLPLNTVLWRGLVQVERNGRRGFLIGLASLFDEDERIVWRWVPQIASTGSTAPPLLNEQENLNTTPINSLTEDHRGLTTAKWFSQDNWVMIPPSEPNSVTIIHDIRFGSMKLDQSPIDPATHPWAFSF